jgi:hypothetical protein
MLPLACYGCGGKQWRNRSRQYTDKERSLSLSVNSLNFCELWRLLSFLKKLFRHSYLSCQSGCGDGARGLESNRRMAFEAPAVVVGLDSLFLRHFRPLVRSSGARDDSKRCNHLCPDCDHTQK